MSYSIYTILLSSRAIFVPFPILQNCILSTCLWIELQHNHNRGQLVAHCIPFPCVILTPLSFHSVFFVLWTLEYWFVYTLSLVRIRDHLLKLFCLRLSATWLFPTDPSLPSLFPPRNLSITHSPSISTTITFYPVKWVNLYYKDMIWLILYNQLDPDHINNICTTIIIYICYFRFIFLPSSGLISSVFISHTTQMPFSPVLTHQ